MEEMKIEIPCNRKVRDYTLSQLKTLTGLSISRAYELMRETGSLPVAESSNIMKRGKQTPHVAVPGKMGQVFTRTAR